MFGGALGGEGGGALGGTRRQSLFVQCNKDLAFMSKVDVSATAHY